jgi:hypothetical protein
MEEITKRFLIQTPVLFIGATLLIVGAIGYWPFSDPPLQIQSSLMIWALIVLGFLLIVSGIIFFTIEVRHLKKAELDKYQFARFQKELKLKSEALTSQQEMVKMKEEILNQQHGENNKQLEKIRSELSDRNENFTELRQKYALALLTIQIVEQESERIIEEYSDNYWGLY